MTEPTINQAIAEGKRPAYRKTDEFYTNFDKVDENARIQDFLPKNIIETIKQGEHNPFWVTNEELQTPQDSRAPKHPYRPESHFLKNF